MTLRRAVPTVVEDGVNLVQACLDCIHQPVASLRPVPTVEFEGEDGVGPGPSREGMAYIA